MLTTSLFLVGAVDSAWAAPSGMCSEEAESIAAPPPMFPADDATLRACDDDADLSFNLMGSPSSGERIAPSDGGSRGDGVLAGSLIVPRPTSLVRRIDVPISSDSSEHRWLGLRPPRS